MGPDAPLLLHGGGPSWGFKPQPEEVYGDRLDDVRNELAYPACESNQELYFRIASMLDDWEWDDTEFKGAKRRKVMPAEVASNGDSLLPLQKKGEGKEIIEGPADHQKVCPPLAGAQLHGAVASTKMTAEQKTYLIEKNRKEALERRTFQQAVKAPLSGQSRTPCSIDFGSLSFMPV